MSRNIKYNVIISFSRVKVEKAIGKREIPYYLGKGATDTIIFYKKKIVMSVCRSTKCSKSDIISKTNNTINSQIIKAIILFYANAINFPKLESIKVNISTLKSSIEEYTLEGGELPLILNPKHTRDGNLHFCPTKAIWEETGVGNAARIATSYWLDALDVQDRHTRFNRLWIAFNALFAYFGNKKAEVENLMYIRHQIQANKGCFSKTRKLVAGYTTQQLREQFRWMILCKADMKRSMKRFYDSLISFNEARIIELFRGITQSHQLRPKILSSSFQTGIDAHLSRGGTSEDIEIVILLCIKYAYFLRNQRQHGQIMDYNFKLTHNKEDEELDNINQLLSNLLLEMLDNISTFSVQS